MARVFAGPLSRFFARDDGDAVRFRAGIEAWRRDLGAALAERVRAQFDWDEAAAAGTWWDLGDAGWPALRLFAFYAERSDLEMPDNVPALLELDREFRAASDLKFGKTLYGQLLACEMWLPADFPVTLRAPLPDGTAAEIGSVPVLLAQLRWLNARTFQADAAEIVRWTDLPAPAGGALLDAARRGYAGLLAAATAAEQQRLPVAIQQA